MIAILNKQYTIKQLEETISKEYITQEERKVLRAYPNAIYHIYNQIRLSACGNPCSKKPTLEDVKKNINYSTVSHILSLSKEEIDYILDRIDNWEETYSVRSK